MKYAGNELKYGLFLGPMAGVTDMVYRQLCQEQGCEVTYTEMISAKAIYYNNKKTDTLMAIGEKEQNVGIQLFGREPGLMAEMAKRIDNERITSFDVNMGCPVPKVVNNGEGSALMKEPLLIGKIVEALAKATHKPISIKIRAGFNDENLNAPEVTRIAQESGAAHVAIHGRSREQYYSGKADWNIIKAAKEGVSIPIIGNGDVESGEDVKRIMTLTGCDGVMVGRGAMGNPWVFKEIIHVLENTIYTPPTNQEIVDAIHRHGLLLVDHKGEYIAMREMRKHVSWYTKGIKNATKLRNEINKVEKMEDLDLLIQKLLV